MRGTAALPSPHPLADLLPTPLQEDPFVVRLTQGLDDVLGPAIAVLDCLPAYLDPALTPADFLGWLAGWVGVDPDENWTERHLRSLVAHAVDLHRHQGTTWGVQWYLDLVAPCRTRVVDPTRCTWSVDPTTTGPDVGDGVLVVRVPAAEGSEENTRAVDRLVRALKPAHVPHRVEVVDHLD
ncbi:phage tail protein [Actinokineospora bangkokensis]|uniref:Phage tail protein n=1 Tax=Actinokineospora bangkokensis TaxID=1193682 RepID=A0A1Q9LM62_9PSEU|nr:phage tail protein [Actinokineospora bangkokensis]OLR93083.1 hypothetical protein BJP25_19235 [Actinokineospora bangkokensis]